MLSVGGVHAFYAASAREWWAPLYASKRTDNDFTFVPKPPALAPRHDINFKTPIEFERRV